MTDARPVWITREQRIALFQMYCRFGGYELKQVIDAWDAAPADPTEAVVSALYDQLVKRYPGIQIRDVKSSINSLAMDAAGVLRALGKPDD